MKTLLCPHIGKVPSLADKHYATEDSTLLTRSNNGSEHGNMANCSHCASHGTYPTCVLHNVAATRNVVECTCFSVSLKVDVIIFFLYTDT